MKVDMRILTVDIPQQEVISKDNVPLNINAVVYYQIENAEKAILNIQDYPTAVADFSQVALCDVVGGFELDQILSDRESIAEKIKEIVASEKGIVSGELKLGIIPTLAPYLLPLFLKKMKEAFPLVKLLINELTTDVIIQKLKTGEIDLGILATPLHDKRLNERPLFYEKYYLYVNDKEKGFNKQFVLPKEIDVNRLWLLEEGHCMRSQILNFCALKKQHEFEESFHYNAGSIETLKNMVDANFGMTIIPELATHNLSKTQSKRIRLFNDPIPVREISLVTHREFLKEKLIKKLEEVILSVIPSEMQVNKKRNIIEL